MPPTHAAMQTSPQPGDPGPADAPSVGPGAAPWWGIAEVVLAVVLAGVVFSLFQNPTQHIDELYHTLAAQSLLDDGDLMIGETGEPYTRARGYTYMVAASFKVFGPGVWQSRLPSMLAGLVLVAVMFLWVRWRFGRLPAWLWVLLMLQAPMVVYATELCRFYMVQTAALAMMLVAVDVALQRQRGCVCTTRAIVVAVLAGAVALHMQVSSIFGIAVILGGAVYTLLWRMGAGRPSPARFRAIAIGGVTVVGLLFALAGVLWVEPVRMKWQLYSSAVPWAAATRDSASYYVSYFERWHRWPFYFAPVAALLACRVWGWRAAWIAGLFAAGLLAHSYGGMKAPRYLLWAMPYLWLAIALGVSAIPALVAPARSDDDTTPAADPARGLRVAVSVVAVLALAFALHRTVGPHQVRAMLTDGEHAFRYPDWPAVRASIQADPGWDGGVLVASVDTKALAALGRCDYSLSASRTEGRDEFAPDWRTGVPVISVAESMRRVIGEHPAGLIVIEEDHWRQGWAVSDQVADVIEAEAEPVAMDPAYRLRVYRWGQGGDMSEQYENEGGP